MTLEVQETIDGLRKVLDHHRQAGENVGFVPTMGALHAGHVSLIERARQECDVVVVSIFVNPLQFGANEDLEKYPRPFDDDLNLARAAGVDVVFAPPISEMYPEGAPKTSVSVADLGDALEGAGRPGHFDGVATVVTKLLNIVGNCRAYFGEKDWQQLTVVKRMVADLCIAAEIVPCATVREVDGLAMSSRNAYLGADERKIALSLHRALAHGGSSLQSGDVDVEQVCQSMMQIMRDAGAEPAYAEVVGENLVQARTPVGELRLLVAAHVGSTRLIDNIGVFVPETVSP